MATTVNLAFGYLAGALSTLSPCVLPLLPVLLGGALQQHRLAPLALAGGVALSFTTIGVFVATLGFAIGIDLAVIRSTAAILMIAFGTILLSPRLQLAFANAAGPLSSGASAALGRVSGDGVAGQFAIGLLLGAVWAPCAGPTLGAALGLAAEGGSTEQAALIMVVFSLGAVSPMLALAYGSRNASPSLRARLTQLAAWSKPAMGVVILLMGILIVSGFDKTLETGLTDAMPSWLVELTTRY